MERQNEREQEIRDTVDELEQQGDRMEERSAEVAHDIDETRDEIERKERAEDVPGLQEPGQQGGSGPPPEADIAPGDSE